MPVIRLVVCSLESLAQKIPHWLRSLVDARQILLIPINWKAVHNLSHIYGDKNFTKVNPKCPAISTTNPIVTGWFSLMRLCIWWFSLGGSPHNLDHLPHLDWGFKCIRKIDEAVSRNCIWIESREKSSKSFVVLNRENHIEN